MPPAAKAHDVRHVGPAPLVDRLIVVADDAQLHRRLGEELDQPLLCRVDVLVLVDDEMPKRRVHALEDYRLLQRGNGQRDELRESEEVVTLQHRPVVGAHLAEWRARERGRVDQLVAEHVDRLHQVADRSPMPRAQA